MKNIRPRRQHVYALMLLALTNLPLVACGHSSGHEDSATNQSALINGTAYSTTNTATQDPNLVGIWAEQRNDERREGVVKCSGVVVGSTGKAVITAAHCLTEWSTYYAFKGNVNDSGALTGNDFKPENQLSAAELSDNAAHAVVNPTFLQLDGQHKKNDPLKPWPSDIALMYLSSPYGTGLSFDCNALPAKSPTSVRVHTASTQGKMAGDEPDTLTFPLAGKRGTKTYGDFDLITQTSEPAFKKAVLEGVQAGMYVVGKGKSGERMTAGDSGGPAYPLDNPKLLVGLIEGGSEPRRDELGDIGWISPLNGKNCEWLSAIDAYSNVLAVYYDDLDGDGTNDVRLRLETANNGADLQLVASTTLGSGKWPGTWPNGTFTFPGVGSIAPRFVTVGKYLNSTYLAAVANRSEIRLFSTSDGTQTAKLAFPTGFSSLVGMYTMHVNPDSQDDLVLLDDNGTLAVYLGNASGLALDSTARVAAIKYDSDDLVDVVAVVKGKLYVSQSTLAYAPAQFSTSTSVEDVAAGRFRSDSTNNKGQFLMRLSSDAATSKVLLCSYPHSNGCPYVADTKTATTMAVRDVNRDGFDDVFISYSDRKSTWLFGGGTVGSSSATAAFTTATVSDINADGLDDYTATLNDGTSVLVIGTEDGPALAEQIDVNGDGRTDIRFKRANGAYGWWINTGTGYARDVPRDEFVIFGTSWISINNGTIIYPRGGELAAVGGFGVYPYYKQGGVDPISVWLGTDTIGVDVWSKNLITANDRAEIAGDVWTSQAMLAKYSRGFYCANCNTISLGGKAYAGSAEVLTKNLSDVTYTFPTPTAGTLRPNGILPPGDYDAVVADNNMAVTFTAGRYTFNSLKFEPSTTVNIDSTNGPVYLLVKKELIMRATPVDTRGYLDQLFIGYWGTNGVGIDAPLAATLVAPNAQLSLNSAVLPHRGALFADSVVMHQWSRLEHHKFAGKWPGSH